MIKENCVYGLKVVIINGWNKGAHKYIINFQRELDMGDCVVNECVTATEGNYEDACNLEPWSLTK